MRSRSMVFDPEAEANAGANQVQPRGVALQRGAPVVLGTRPPATTHLSYDLNLRPSRS